MKRNYITVDGGTTNTRIRLVCNNNVSDTVKADVGARNGSEALKKALKDGIRTLLERNRLAAEEIHRILASGMITSEFGLVELPHVSAPAGIKELHDSLYETAFPEITPIPFCFIRGIRTAGQDLADTDMMRGEETELMGILREGAGIYVLPGSHSKIVRTDEAGRITAFSTMLTGEMLAALSSGTILKDAVTLEDHPLDEEALTEGCRYALQHGINEALFKVRVMKNIFHHPPAALYSFFLGTVLSDEITAITRHPAPFVLVAGKAALKNATLSLLRHYTQATVLATDDVQAEYAAALGAVKIYEY